MHGRFSEQYRFGDLMKNRNWWTFGLAKEMTFSAANVQLGD